MAKGAPDESFELTGTPPGNRDQSDQPDFRSLIESLARTRSSPLEVFADFARVAACALAAQTREAEYLAVAKNYSRAELEIFARVLAGLVSEMEAQPFTDLLGPYYLEIGSKFARDLRGEFYTPQPIGDLMTRMLVDAPGIIDAGRPVTVCDPAGGSGGLILSLAAEFARANAVDLLRVTCQDVSKIACDLAYLNLTLWGVPARIIQGDSLRNSVEHEWKNLHWFRVGEPQREAVNGLLALLRSKAEPEAPPPSDPAPLTSHHGRQGWMFE